MMRNDFLAPTWLYCKHDLEFEVSDSVLKTEEQEKELLGELALWDEDYEGLNSRYKKVKQRLKQKEHEAKVKDREMEKVRNELEEKKGKLEEANEKISEGT